MYNDPTATHLNRKFATVPVLPEENLKDFHGLMLEMAGLTPDEPTAAADLKEYIRQLEAVKARLDEKFARVKATAEFVRAMNADPRTPEQKELDELAADWRDTYTSLR